MANDGAEGIARRTVVRDMSEGIPDEKPGKTDLSQAEKNQLKTVRCQLADAYRRRARTFESS
jgi:hypothetical protein